MSIQAPDIFTNVHKGLRRALFEVCTALGRAGGDAESSAAARARLRQALQFVAHHGANEDELLLPLLEARAPHACARMRAAHAEVASAQRSLELAVAGPDEELYQRACWFTTLYLDHMREEERELEPEIRAALTHDELVEFGRRAVARTAPDDRQLMLGWMLPALPRADVERMLSHLPAAEAERLRALA